MSRLNYFDESYVRTYRRQTTAWKLLPWEARALFRLVSTELDRAGVLSLDGEAPEDVLALHTGMPPEVVKNALPHLTKRGYLVVTNEAIFDPDFIEAESAVQSDKVRASESRARRRDKLTSRNVTGSHETPPASAPRDISSDSGSSHEPEQAVTKRDGAITQRDDASREPDAAESDEQNVTQYSAVQSSAVHVGARESDEQTQARLYRDDPTRASTDLGPPERWPPVRRITASFTSAFGRPCQVRGGLKDGRTRAIVERMAEGLSTDQLELAIRTSASDRFVQSNPHLQNLAWLLGAPERVDGWLAAAAAPRPAYAHSPAGFADDTPADVCAPPPGIGGLS